MNKQPRWQQSDWKKFRLKVLKRDNYTCRRCGLRTEKRQNVHEIIYEYLCGNLDKPIYKMKNCITLCFECHRVVDPQFDSHMFDNGLNKRDFPKPLVNWTDSLTKRQKEAIIYRIKVYGFMEEHEKLYKSIKGVKRKNEENIEAGSN